MIREEKPGRPTLVRPSTATATRARDGGSGMPVPREVGRVGGAADGGKRGAAQAARDVVVLPRAETWAVDELRLRAGAHTYVHDDMAYSAIQNKRTSEHGAAHVVLKLCMVSVFKQFWPKSSHASCMTGLRARTTLPGHHREFSARWQTRLLF